MSTATLIPLSLRHDITATLARLRIARTVQDTHETRICERRLDWLLEQLPRSTESPRNATP